MSTLARLSVDLVANSAGFRKELDKASKRTGKFSRKAQADFKRVATAVVALTGAVAGLAGREIVQAADSMTNLRNRMFALTESSEKTAIAMRDIKKIAKLTRSDIKSTGDVYTKMAIATKDLGVNQEELAKATAAVNNTFLLSGASSMEAANSARQLAQGLAAGRLNGDELRSVMENNTVLAGMLAEGFGKTRGELKQMGADGLLTADKIMPILIAAFDSTSKSVGTMNMTVAQATTLMRNRFVELADSANQSFGFTTKIANGIAVLSENMKRFATQALYTLALPALYATTVAVKALTVAMIGNPIGALFAATAIAIGYAAQKIHDNWYAVQEFFNKSFTLTLPNLLDSFKLGFANLVLSIKTDFNNLLSFLNPAVNQLIEMYNAIPFLDDANPVTLNIDVEGSLARVDALKAGIEERIAGYQPLARMMSTSPHASTDGEGGVGGAGGVDFGQKGQDPDLLAATEKAQTLKDIWSDLSSHAKMENAKVVQDEKGKWGGILDSAAKGSKKMLMLKRAIAIKEIIVSTAASIAASAKLGFPQAIPGIAMAVANGAQQLQAVKGQFHDGIDNVPNTGTYLLEQGERVVDKRLNRDMSQFLATQNSSGSVTNNPTLNFNVSGGDAENVEKMLLNHRGKFESMIRDIYNESAQNSPF